MNNYSIRDHSIILTKKGGNKEFNEKANIIIKNIAKEVS